MSEPPPTLWHLAISHYNEKARWALAYKRVAHRRRAPVPGSHVPIAFVLTRGRQITFPILQIDGRTIGDSTAIVSALEERYPEPPLYPAGPEDRRRALELEDFFDEELGPHIRLLVFHELARDPDSYARLIERTTPGILGKAGPASARYASFFTGIRFGVHDDQAAALAREKVIAALDRLEAELQGSSHLVGDRFTVADLTAASLLNPLVLPEGGPVPTDVPPPQGMRRFREALEGRPAFEWVRETYRRHRRPKASSRESAPA